MRKTLVILLAVLMLLSMILIGCTKDEPIQSNESSKQGTDVDGSNDKKDSENKTDGKNDKESSEPAPVTEFPDDFPKVPKPVDSSVYAYDDLKEKYDFEIMLPGAFNQPIPDDLVKEYLDKKFNVNLTLTNMMAEDLRNAVAVRFSSGDAPDVVKMPFKDVAISLFEQGQLIDGLKVLPYMPQLAQYVTQTYKTYATVDGKMIGIPRYGTFPDNWGYFIRVDWLEQFGMKKPTNEDDLFEYAKAVTFNDPNQNGKDDTWFMGGAGGGNGFGMLDNLRCMYGHPSWNVVDGKVNHPMLDGTTKSFLQYLKKLYDNKLLAPDWYTISWEPFKQYSMNDQIGMVYYPGWNIIDETYNAHNQDPEYTKVWEPIDPPKSSDGRGGKYAPGKNPDGLFIFSKELEKNDKKLKRLAHLIDTCIYPNENYWAVSQGGGPEIWPDGSEVTFNEEDGTNIFYIKKDVHPAYIDQKYNSLPDWQFIGYTLIWQVYNDEPVGVTGSKHNMYVNSLPRYENYDLLLTLDSDIVAKMREFTMKNEIAFVLGDRSFDEWDKYVEEWKKAGGQELMDQVAEQLGISK